MPSRRHLLLLILALIALSLPLALLAQEARAGEFALRSADLPRGRPIAARHVYAGFGCDGGNLSPALAWTDPPPGTRSFAVTAYDPDAPTGSGWWHWVVLDLPADLRALPRGGAPLPAGAVQTRTDFGAPGYGGPCPPPGKPHRYRFQVWALKTASLGLSADASGAMAGFMIRANALGHATLEASYGR